MWSPPAGCLPTPGRAGRLAADLLRSARGRPSSRSLCARSCCLRMRQCRRAARRHAMRTPCAWSGVRRSPKCTPWHEPMSCSGPGRLRPPTAATQRTAAGAGRLASRCNSFWRPQALLQGPPVTAQVAEPHQASPTTRSRSSRAAHWRSTAAASRSPAAAGSSRVSNSCCRRAPSAGRIGITCTTVLRDGLVAAPPRRQRGVGRRQHIPAACAARVHAEDVQSSRARMYQPGDRRTLPVQGDHDAGGRVSSSKPVSSAGARQHRQQRRALWEGLSALRVRVARDRLGYLDRRGRKTPLKLG